MRQAGVRLSTVGAARLGLRARVPPSAFHSNPKSQSPNLNLRTRKRHSDNSLLRPGGCTVEVDDRLRRLRWNLGPQKSQARRLVTAVTGLQRLAIRRNERG